MNDAPIVPIGVVEAKRKAKSVVSAVEQSKRYARSFRVAPPLVAAGSIDESGEAPVPPS